MIDHPQSRRKTGASKCYHVLKSKLEVGSYLKNLRVYEGHFFHFNIYSLNVYQNPATHDIPSRITCRVLEERKFKARIFDIVPFASSTPSKSMKSIFAIEISL